MVVLHGRRRVDGGQRTGAVDHERVVLPSMIEVVAEAGHKQGQALCQRRDKDNKIISNWWKMKPFPPSSFIGHHQSDGATPTPSECHARFMVVNLMISLIINAHGHYGGR